MNIGAPAVHDSTARHPLEPGGRAQSWDHSAQRHGVASLTSSRPLLGYTEVRALAVISMLSSIFATLIGLYRSVQFALAALQDRGGGPECRVWSRSTNS